MQANIDGELNFASDGCLDIVEHDNTIVDEDSEFEEVEYVDEDANEDGEFDGDESLVVDNIANMDMFNLQNDDVSKLQLEVWKLLTSFTVDLQR
ncbi:unnamed protein product [Vicia faba]|uniref:Uncharacterized protein n=1 Tax=Vicia faba TaxID=3906 RepID=A0AAV0Z556_VICFA|nr:unnamed protein product [Vicia faba]